MARSLTLDRGGRLVLNGVSLTVGPTSRVGVIGPNGVGKSSLLQVLSGAVAPDGGEVALDPPSATVGYLAQEHAFAADGTVGEVLARRTGGVAAEEELAEAAAALADGTGEAARRYEIALDRFNGLGVADLQARIDAALDDLGVGAAQAARDPRMLSGGQRAKVALAAVELSRFDVTLLDEPTNDLDFEGLHRLETWLKSRPGGMVIVSHDRDFLERTVTTVVELDAHSRTAHEFGGGWRGYQAERADAHRHAREVYERYDRRRAQLDSRAERQRRWATTGVRREARHPRDNDKA
ncbi:MAG: ATP-binding cassette domain-containing protein, partial [Acidimicrobiales bacterium]